MIIAAVVAAKVAKRREPYQEGDSKLNMAKTKDQLSKESIIAE